MVIVICVGAVNVALHRVAQNHVEHVQLQSQYQFHNRSMFQDPYQFHNRSMFQDLFLYHNLSMFQDLYQFHNQYVTPYHAVVI